jgi:hypothetical protein
LVRRDKAEPRTTDAGQSGSFRQEQGESGMDAAGPNHMSDIGCVHNVIPGISENQGVSC